MRMCVRGSCINITHDIQIKILSSSLRYIEMRKYQSIVEREEGLTTQADPALPNTPRSSGYNVFLHPQQCIAFRPYSKVDNMTAE